jgi:hypothetical protein
MNCLTGEDGAVVQSVDQLQVQKDALVGNGDKEQRPLRVSRFAYLVFLLALASLYCILAGNRVKSQPFSHSLHVGRCTMGVSVSRHRWSITHEGFGIPPREGWIEWK